MNRHGVGAVMTYGRTSSPISVQSAAGSQPLPTPPADKSLPPGIYTVNAAAGLYGGPAGAGGGQAPIMTVPPGTSVRVSGPTQNYFAQVEVPTSQTDSVYGWMAVPALSPNAPTAVGGIGGSRPTIGGGSTPSGDPAYPGTPAPAEPKAPSSMTPILLGAAALGAFFLLEQKKKPGRRRR